jgi:MFS family permease
MTDAGAAGAAGRSRTWLTVGLISLITAVAFEGMAVPTAMPAMVAELGGLELYGWSFSAFWLTNLIGISLAGMDADRRGPGRAFVAGVAFFALGMLVSGLAVSMEIVILGRAVQGFGAGAIGAIVYVVIARGYPASEMPRMIAYLSSAWVVPGLVGPAVAGLVADTLSWRWVFLGLVPPIALIGFGVARRIASLGPSADALATERAELRRRVFDAVRLALGSSAVLVSLTIGQPLLAVVLLLVGGWLMLAALRRLLPPGTLLARRGRPAVIAAMFLVSFAFFGTESFVPLAVTNVRGGTTTAGGLALPAAAVTWAVSSWLQARLAPTRSRRLIVGSGAACITIGIGIVALVLLPAAPIWVAPLGWGVAGLGMGLANSTLALLILETAAPGQEGASSAALQQMFTLGTALGAGIGGAMVAVAETSNLPLATGIAAADGAMVIAGVIAVLVALRVPPRPSDGRRSDVVQLSPEPVTHAGVHGG